MPTSEQISNAFERYMEAINDGDVERIVALFADDAYIEDPIGHERLTDAAAIRTHFDSVVEAGAKLSLAAPIRAAESGWGAAAFQAITPVGEQTYVVDVIDVYGVDDDGRITSLTAYWGPTNLSAT